MADLLKQLSEILNKMTSATEKIAFLERILKETKEGEARDLIKKLLAQVEKDLEEKKRNSAAKAKQMGEFEKIILGEIERKPVHQTMFTDEIVQETEPIEKKLQFFEETDEKKPAVENELAYLEKPGERPAYAPSIAEKKAEGREYVAHASKFQSTDSRKPGEDREWSAAGTYKKREPEDYVPTSEIAAESLEKEEYKRKKRL